MSLSRSCLSNLLASASISSSSPSTPRPPSPPAAVDFLVSTAATRTSHSSSSSSDESDESSFVVVSPVLASPPAVDDSPAVVSPSELSRAVSGDSNAAAASSLPQSFCLTAASSPPVAHRSLASVLAASSSSRFGNSSAVCFAESVSSPSVSDLAAATGEESKGTDNEDRLVFEKTTDADDLPYEAECSDSINSSCQHGIPGGATLGSSGIPSCYACAEEQVSEWQPSMQFDALCYPHKPALKRTLGAFFPPALLEHLGVEVGVELDEDAWTRSQHATRPDYLYDASLRNPDDERVVSFDIQNRAWPWIWSNGDRLAHLDDYHRAMTIREATREERLYREHLCAPSGYDRCEEDDQHRLSFDQTISSPSALQWGSDIVLARTGNNLSARYLTSSRPFKGRFKHLTPYKLDCSNAAGWWRHETLNAKPNRNSQKDFLYSRSSDRAVRNLWRREWEVFRAAVSGACVAPSVTEPPWKDWTRREEQYNPWMDGELPEPESWWRPKPSRHSLPTADPVLPPSKHDVLLAKRSARKAQVAQVRARQEDRLPKHLQSRSHPLGESLTEKFYSRRKRSRANRNLIPQTRPTLCAQRGARYAPASAQSAPANVSGSFDDFQERFLERHLESIYESLDAKNLPLHWRFRMRRIRPAPLAQKVKDDFMRALRKVKPSESELELTYFGTHNGESEMASVCANGFDWKGQQPNVSGGRSGEAEGIQVSTQAGSACWQWRWGEEPQFGSIFVTAAITKGAQSVYNWDLWSNLENTGEGPIRFGDERLIRDATHIVPMCVIDFERLPTRPWKRFPTREGTKEVDGVRVWLARKLLRKAHDQERRKEVQRPRQFHLDPLPSLSCAFDDELHTLHGPREGGERVMFVHRPAIDVASQVQFASAMANYHCSCGACGRRPHHDSDDEEEEKKGDDNHVGEQRVRARPPARECYKTKLLHEAGVYECHCDFAHSSYEPLPAWYSYQHIIWPRV